MAKALDAVGYNVVVQNDIDEFRGLSRVLDDEHIIPWLGRQKLGIWVHKDNEARTRHARQIQAERVRTIWLAEPGGADFSSAGQLRLMAYGLPRILREWSSPSASGWLHYEIRPRGSDRIIVTGFVLQPPEAS